MSHRLKSERRNKALSAIDDLLGLDEEEGGYLGQLIGAQKRYDPDISGSTSNDPGRRSMAKVTGSAVAGAPGIRERFAGGPTVRPDYPSGVPEAPIPPTFKEPKAMPWWKHALAIGMGAAGGASGPQVPAMVARNVYELPQQRAQEAFGREEQQYERDMAERGRQEQLEETGRGRRTQEGLEMSRDEETARYRAGETELGRTREERERREGEMSEKRQREADIAEGTYRTGVLEYQGREAGAAERRAVAEERRAQTEAEVIAPARAKQYKETADYYSRRPGTTGAGATLTEAQRARIMQWGVTEKRKIQERYAKAARYLDLDDEDKDAMADELADIDDQVEEQLGPGGETVIDYRDIQAGAAGRRPPSMRGPTVPSH